ncbi:MAG: hypothetical protein D6732_20610 [Methanobacteriota archaeon]|nr:MAG: hypothetical protein D6732_20610 [Euryarchaeota archaeon]
MKEKERTTKLHPLKDKMILLIHCRYREISMKTHQPYQRKTAHSPRNCTSLSSMPKRGISLHQPFTLANQNQLGITFTSYIRFYVELEKTKPDECTSVMMFPFSMNSTKFPRKPTIVMMYDFLLEGE